VSFDSLPYCKLFVQKGRRLSGAFSGRERRKGGKLVGGKVESTDENLNPGKEQPIWKETRIRKQRGTGRDFGSVLEYPFPTLLLNSQVFFFSSTSRRDFRQMHYDFYTGYIL